MENFKKSYCFKNYNGKCTFNDYYGLTELIPTDDQNEYRIVCTGFMSKKMQFNEVFYKNMSLMGIELE